MVRLPNTPACNVIQHTQQWKDFVKGVAFMERKATALIAEGRDLDEDPEFQELVERFEEKVVAALERQWQLVRRRYGDKEDG